MDELVRVESIAPETYGILVVRLLCSDPDRPYSPPQIRGCVEERLGIFNAPDRHDDPARAWDKNQSEFGNWLCKRSNPYYKR